MVQVSRSQANLVLLQLTSTKADTTSRPTLIRLFTNRTANIDFDEADEAEPTQEIELKETDWNSEDTASVSLRYVKFQKITTLILYVQRGEEGAETVRLDRIRLIGEAGPTREMGKLQKVGEEEN